jgi:hypothetical protein
MFGALLALVALVLEIIHWATTRDASLLFYALVLTTVAVLVEWGYPHVAALRRV